MMPATMSERKFKGEWELYNIEEDRRNNTTGPTSIRHRRPARQTVKTGQPVPSATLGPFRLPITGAPNPTGTAAVKRIKSAEWSI